MRTQRTQRTRANKWIMVALIVLLFFLIGAYSLMLGPNNQPALETGGYYQIGQ